ncbi:hypothetical protein JUJ52_19695 [Virgibacillus sp. AGTR]|uniref:hypothetical protein n=1 Tax=Virgibacillus sp. AGTR TaxID=2812055 RepID=UPI001D166224|nr:hypothetical protein [Virgibacillus sp. AGTR]MCC2252157.1 hypothetical protein [Virgibacillus sp. AGTR]
MTKKRAKDIEVAIYKGDTFLFAGTIEECAAHRNVKPDTIRFYMTKAYQRKLAKRKRSRDTIQVIRLDDDDDE